MGEEFRGPGRVRLVLRESPGKETRIDPPNLRPGTQVHPKGPTSVSGSRVTTVRRISTRGKGRGVGGFVNPLVEGRIGV